MVKAIAGDPEYMCTGNCVTPFSFFSLSLSLSLSFVFVFNSLIQCTKDKIKSWENFKLVTFEVSISQNSNKCGLTYSIDIKSECTCTLCVCVCIFS